MSDITHPRSVITGVSVLYISLLLSFVSGIINVIHVAYGMKSLALSDAPAPFTPAVMFAIVVIVTLFFWWIISRINARKNWARIFYLVLVIATLLAWALNFDATLAQGIFALISSVINTLLGIIAMVCLFTPTSNEWFKKGCVGKSCE